MASWYKEYDALNGIVISSRIRLARNLANFPFPRKMSRDMFETLKTKVRQALANLEGKVDLKFIEMNDVPENEIKAMVERHVISPDFANLCRDRAIAISPDENISIMTKKDYSAKDDYNAKDPTAGTNGEHYGPGAGLYAVYIEWATERKFYKESVGD